MTSFETYTEKFRIGQAYTSEFDGSRMKIIGVVASSTYGTVLVRETLDGNFVPISDKVGDNDGWVLDSDSPYGFDDKIHLGLTGRERH